MVNNNKPKFKSGKRCCHLMLIELIKFQEWAVERKGLKNRYCA